MIHRFTKIDGLSLTSLSGIGLDLLKGSNMNAKSVAYKFGMTQRLALVLTSTFIGFAQEWDGATIFITVDQGHLIEPEELRYKSQNFDLKDKETLLSYGCSFN